MNIIKPDMQWQKGAVFGLNKPEYVIIHHALAKKCTIGDVHAWHLNKGWSGFGYHYFIDKEGHIFKGREEAWNGAHTEEQGMNNKSIGICLEGCYEDYSNQTDKEVPAKQIDALIELVKDLMMRYNITIDKVKPHRYFAHYKNCPGTYFPWETFIKRLKPNNELAALLDDIKVCNIADPQIIADKALWQKKATDDVYIRALIGKAARYVRSAESKGYR